jgi:hypothetical protein
VPSSQVKSGALLQVDDLGGVVLQGLGECVDAGEELEDEATDREDVSWESVSASTCGGREERWMEGGGIGRRRQLGRRKLRHLRREGGRGIRAGGIGRRRDLMGRDGWDGMGWDEMGIPRGSVSMGRVRPRIISGALPDHEPGVRVRARPPSEEGMRRAALKLVSLKTDVPAVCVWEETRRDEVRRDRR